MTFNGSGGLSAAGQTVTVGAGSSISTTAGASISAGSVAINGGSVSFGGNGSLNASGAVSVGGGGSLSFAGNGNVNSQSFALDPGSSFTINFATGGDPTNVVLTGGSGSLNGTVNITGTPNTNTSFNLVTGAGSVDITGVTLGTVPSGAAFGFHLAGTTTIVLDVTVNPITPDGTGSATGAWHAAHVAAHHRRDRQRPLPARRGLHRRLGRHPDLGQLRGQGMTLLTSQVTGTSGAFIYGLVAPAARHGHHHRHPPRGPCSAVGALSRTPG